MAFDITNKTHCSAFINLTNKAAVALFDLQQQLNDYAILDNVNGVSAALGAGGAVFPSGITLSPTDVNDARFALETISNALNTAMTSGVQTSINKVRESIGILSGTG